VSNGARGETDAAFILHTYPYSETSLILETFTRLFGRVSMMAKGARRPRSAMRGVLNSFQPLSLSWFGKSELKTLKGAEHMRIYPQLQGQALLSAFYLNELILKLAHREDPHEGLFDAYDRALLQLLYARGTTAEEKSASRPIAAILRQFEKQLLAELGYGLVFDHDAAGKPIDPAGRYIYVVERGAVLAGSRAAAANAAVELRGKTLLDMAEDNYSDAVTAQQSKQLMRHVINHHLNGADLNTRQLIRELQQT
jgi:DNA repair protein RecO (recombination protein O)